MKTSRFLCALTLGLAVTSASFAATRPQEPSEAQQEMMELFRKVEKRLRSIDELLSDAGAGDTSRLTGVGSAGLDELLEETRSASKQVVEDIDRILEISAQQSQPSSSGGGSGEPQSGQDSPSSGSPLDRGQQSTPGENTPELPSPGEQPGEQPGQTPVPGGDQPQPMKPEPNPTSGQDVPDPDPKNVSLGDQAPTPAGAPSTSSGVERWGALPKHAQDVFRSEGGTELPAEYRDWIDAYHRRLNRESGRR